MRTGWLRHLNGVFVIAMIALLSVITSAQSTSTSSALAEELGKLMDDAELTAVAAGYSDVENRYVAALYFSGRQLLVIAGDYSAPQLLDVKIVAGNYRDVYVDLNSSSPPETRLFVDDYGANGLARVPVDGIADRFTRANQVLLFNSDWAGQQLSETSYNEAYSTADSDFAEMLSILIDQVTES
ncbi:MAG TPA: hypothetical protein QGH09_07315 [Vicinamibacterales bacterium]|jgi:hypothetical protein|nr:hypothetical protein [Vicinamibacterales bacterium]|tara:strand:- start:2791 stop:3342 length:552 start_codon:yes stop_codon:yes gene_type:complete